MFNKIIKNLLPKKKYMLAEMESVPMSTFNLSAKHISEEARKVIKILQDNDYDALIVGGAVRDLILQQSPKDFDIATNASPQEIRKVFRRINKRAQIIGKRFPIVHVCMGGQQILEVSTFRTYSKAVNEEGRIVKDDKYGSIHEDAMRRDFTCNALYLDPIQEKIYSYHQALKHLENKQLIMIGDADTRFKEDPVRIIRAARISAKTDLKIEISILKSMQKNAHLLVNEPISRLFDEWVKIIYSKHSYASFKLLENLQILDFVHPITKTIAGYIDENYIALVENIFRQTDLRLQQEQSISLGFVIAGLLWPVLNKKWLENKNQGMKPAHALHEAILDVIQNNRAVWDIPNKNLASVNEIWKMQYRLESAKSKQQIEKLLGHPRFRAAYDFFLLRADNGLTNVNKAKWWTEVVTRQHAAPKQNKFNQKKTGSRKKSKAYSNNNDHQNITGVS